MGLIAWVATVFSILYLIWAIRNSSWCFVFGLISGIFWAYESYYNLHLVFDAGLQVFYILFSIYGIYRWQYGGIDRAPKPITRMTVREHLAAVAIGSLLSLMLVHSSQYFEQINYQVLDATTTIFLIVGTYFLVERKLESWIYLVVCDIVYVYIYTQVEAYLFVFMMVLFSLFGIVGYLKWRRIGVLQDATPKQAQNRKRG